MHKAEISKKPLQKPHQTFLQLASQRNMPKRESIGSEHKETVLPEETNVEDDYEECNSFDLQSSSNSRRNKFCDSIVPTERHLILKTKQSMEKPAISNFCSTPSGQCGIVHVSSNYDTRRSRSKNNIAWANECNVEITSRQVMPALAMSKIVASQKQIVVPWSLKPKQADFSHPERDEKRIQAPSKSTKLLLQGNCGEQRQMRLDVGSYRSFPRTKVSSPKLLNSSNLLLSRRGSNKHMPRPGQPKLNKKELDQTVQTIHHILDGIPKVKRGSSKGYKQDSNKTKHRRKVSCITQSNLGDLQIQIQNNYQSSRSQARIKGSFELALEKRGNQAKTSKRKSHLKSHRSDQQVSSQPYVDAGQKFVNPSAAILRPIKVSSCSHESVQNILQNYSSAYSSIKDQQPIKTSLLQVKKQKSSGVLETYRTEEQMRTSLTVVSGRYINDEKENGMVFGRQSGLFKIYESKRPSQRNQGLDVEYIA